MIDFGLKKEVILGRLMIEPWMGMWKERGIEESRGI